MGAVRSTAGKAKRVRALGAVRMLVGAMKLFEGLTGIGPGEMVSVTELGLPVTGRNGLLLVFWKST